MIKKPVRVILVGEAKDTFKRLNVIVGEQIMRGIKNSQEMQLLRSIKQKSELIKVNPFYGENIPKRQIPRGYDVRTLWRVKLSGFWRMLYTIRGDEIEIICFVLDIIDHSTYDKKFGYKKK